MNFISYFITIKILILRENKKLLIYVKYSKYIY